MSRQLGGGFYDSYKPNFNNRAHDANSCNSRFRRPGESKAKASVEIWTPRSKWPAREEGQRQGRVRDDRSRSPQRTPPSSMPNRKYEEMRSATLGQAEDMVRKLFGDSYNPYYFPNSFHPDVTVPLGYIWKIRRPQVLRRIDSSVGLKGLHPEDLTSVWNTITLGRMWPETVPTDKIQKLKELMGKISLGARCKIDARGLTYSKSS